MATQPAPIEESKSLAVVDYGNVQMTGAPIFGELVSSTRYSPEFLEGVIALTVAVLAVPMLPV